ncbi:MAG: M1 family metallopeptidase, partial [Candidatus Omnitrophica bacterium]|nr:M1 family metallopeptidase [Candidatus Omnitrophota bacterium]
MPDQKSNPYLLSRDIAPVLYNIELEPDLENFTFKGNEYISIQAPRPFSKIELHALEITVTRACLVRGPLDSGSRLEAHHVTYNEKRETVILDFGETLKPGQYPTLYLEFSGVLNDKMHGFYRTSYEVAGQKKWGAATQFEATDARRAFPCWDEPARKARFKISLKVPRHLTALSNMPVIEEGFLPATALKRLVFDITPVMSTYLVAFVVAELEYIEAQDKNGVGVRIYTTPGKKEQGRFALGVALHTLPYFADWFGIPYSLPKCDMAALPDFASGAMENWGLVTYRETALLVDPVNSSAAARQRVAEVVAHELAHQWFGNLVTMKWWTDLWLNEGFASYMGPKAVAHQFPEWEVWSQYIGHEFLGALHADSLRNTHAIEIDVQNPHEIREIFDSITYAKGSVVNRMLEHYLGEEAFREGLNLYLKRFEYGNASTQDLWHALEEVSGKPVKAIMASYTRQGGYPVISVSEGKNQNTPSLILEQKRFLFDGSGDKKNPHWKIPVGVAASGLKKPIYRLMQKRKETVALPTRPNKWLKLNPGSSGFFRTAYSPKLFSNLLEAMSRGILAPEESLGVLDDAFALVRAGHLRTSAGLSLLESLDKETDYNLWAGISGSVGSLEMLFGSTHSALGTKISAFGRELFSPIAKKLGWNAKASDTHLDILLRSLVLANMGAFDDRDTIEEARLRFNQFIKTDQMPPDLRGAVYSIVARHGGAKEFDRLLNVYTSAGLQEEKVRVLRAMTRFRTPELVRRAHRFALSGEVRAQDTFIILAGLGSNAFAREANWKFVKSNWSTLVDRFAGGL